MTKDVCQTSLDILKGRIVPLLSSLKSEDPHATQIWLPDMDLIPPKSKTPIETVYHCVLTGNFLKRILESDSWPRAHYKLWVLSQRSKDILMTLGTFQEDEIRVIPRPYIFSYSKNIMEINLKEKINFIFAGRISPTKNIESLLLSTYFLQKNYQLNCQLHLVGPTDNVPHPDRGIFNYDNYFQGIKNLSDSLRWLYPPVFYPRMKSTEWLDLDLKNKVLVNHSTFICEDFNVSLAQAQSVGWSSIISSFGGNTDIILKNSLVLPWGMIARSDETSKMQNLKSKILADYIFSQLFVLLNKANEIKYDSLILPKTLELSRILQNREHLLSHFNLSPEQPLPKDLFPLALTPRGKKFFSYYRQLFGSIDFTDSVAIIINDLNDDRDHRKFLLKKKILIWIERFKGKKIFLISILDIHLPENIYLLGQVTKVCFPFSGKLYEPFFSFIQKLVADNNQIQSIGDL